MHSRRRAIGLVSLGLMLAGTSACTSFAGGQTAAGSQASAAAALSSAATAKPGTYGQPANPSLPNPTAVATDAPVSKPAGTPLSLVVTYAGWQDNSQSVEAAGYVGGIAESHGTCTLTLTQAGRSATATRSGLANGSSTGCPVLRVPRAQLNSGTWTAVLTYQSPTSTAESDKVEVRVP
jgi:hypothetical protein